MILVLADHQDGSPSHLALNASPSAFGTLPVACGGGSGFLQCDVDGNRVAKPCWPPWHLDGLEEAGREPSAYLFLIEICHSNDQTSVSCQDWFPSWAGERVG